MTVSIPNSYVLNYLHYKSKRNSQSYLSNVEENQDSFGAFYLILYTKIIT